MIETFTLTNPGAREFPFLVEKIIINDNCVEHYHDFTEINLIVKGSADHIINGRPRPTKTGDVFVFNEGTSHGFSNARNLTLYQVLYNPKQLMTGQASLKKISGFQALFIVEPSTAGENNYRSYLTLKIRELEMAIQMFEGMIKEFSLRKEGFEAALQASLMSLVVYLSRQYDFTPRENSDIVFRVARTAAYIENNFLSPVSLEELSGYAGVSVWQLIRDFKKHYGTTPANYLLHLKLEHAISLLADEKLTITETAFSSGFSDSNYFARVFKSYTGLSPSQYRKNRLDM